MPNHVQIFPVPAIATSLDDKSTDRDMPLSAGRLP